MKKGYKISLIILLIITTLILGYKFYSRNESIKVAIEWGRLAEIPDNAKQIKVKSRGNIFSRTFYLSFKTTDAELKKWIKNSIDLEQNTWINPNEEKYVKFIDKETGELDSLNLNDQKKGYYWPIWFKIDKINDGEYYKIPNNDEQLYGEVWVDKELIIVYVKVSHS